MISKRLQQYVAPSEVTDTVFWRGDNPASAIPRYFDPNIYTKTHKLITQLKGLILLINLIKELSVKNKGCFRTAKLFC
jgi:hypothetical protein